MATGNNLSRTLEGGHDLCYDFPCSLCEGEGRHVEAEKYCEECFVYLCDPCVRNHNNYPLHKGHKLLDQSQFATMNKSARCQKHPGELINIFSGNHDVVCCSVCKALEHSNCSKTQHLPDAATDVQKSEEYQSIKTGTRALIFDLDKIYNDRKADISRIAKERQHVTHTIADFRKKVNKYFDDLENNTLAELDQREKTIVNGIEQDKKYLESTKTKAEDILKKVETFKGNNESDLFVQVKTELQFLNDAVEKLRDLSQRDVKPSIHFEINRSIEEYIASLKYFGSFSSTHVDTTQPQMSAVSQLTSPPPLVPKRKQANHKVQTFPYKTQYCGKFNVKEKSDTDTCDISSICQLPDDTYLIADWENEKLKRLDQSLKLLDSVQLSGIPHSVCASGPKQAAVSVEFDKKIQFVSVGNRLTLTRSFTVGNYCSGIVCIGNELFVCCGDFDDSFSGCIEVYNNAGHLQRTTARTPQRLYSWPDYVTVSDDGQHLLVTCYKCDAITMLDLDGNVVNTFSHKNLKGPKGICTDGRGQVFVCGYDSYTVVQLSPKHQKIEVILTEADGIKKPRGVWYDKGESRLLVSCKESNELMQFTLK